MRRPGSRGSISRLPCTRTSSPRSVTCSPRCSGAQPPHQTGLRARRRPARDGQPDLRPGDAGRRVPRRGPQAGDLQATAQGPACTRWSLPSARRATAWARRVPHAATWSSRGPAVDAGARACSSSRGAPAAAGSGSVARSEHVTVSVPAGIHEGGRLRVGGAGNAGRMGGPPGDVYVTLHVAPHALFRREGDELHLVVPVAVHEAAFGARDRDSRHRRADTVAGAARDAVGAAFPVARAGRAVAADRPARRSGGGDPVDAAGDARRAVEGAAARARHAERRKRPPSSSISLAAPAGAVAGSMNGSRTRISRLGAVRESSRFRISSFREQHGDEAKR